MQAMKFPYCVFIVGAALVANSQAAVLIDFTGQGTTYDDKSNVLITNLLDSDTGISFQMSVVGIGGNLNSNAGDLGIGDDIIDFGEAVRVSFNTDVLINSIDLGGVSASSYNELEPDLDPDRGSVSFNGATADFLYTDKVGFNGTTDVWTLSSPVSLQAGQVIEFTPDNVNADFDLERISVTAVPEPSATILLGMGGLTLLSRRKRTQRIRMLS
jgi:hypothetical protein